VAVSPRSGDVYVTEFSGIKRKLNYDYVTIAYGG